MKILMFHKLNPGWHDDSVMYNSFPVISYCSKILPTPSTVILTPRSANFPGRYVKHYLVYYMSRMGISIISDSRGHNLSRGLITKFGADSKLQ